MTLVKFKNGPMPVVPTFFDTLFGKDFFDYNFNNAMATMPAANIKETKEDFVLELAAPGMKKSDFKIEVNNNVLTISSEKESKIEETKETFTRKEFSYHSFSRSFNLPQTANKDAIAASYADGMLSVSIPKREEAKEKPSRVIDIA
jgi:HSP20 family protein